MLQLTPTQLTLDHSLPWRFRYSCFKTYEPIITSVIKSFPNRIIVNSSNYGLVPVTFACRFRDAVKSHKANDWPSELIDRELFLKVCDGITTSEMATPGMVTIGDKSSLKSSPVIFSQTGITSETITTELENSFEIICILADNGLLSGEVTLHSESLDLLTLKLKYEQKYDVSIEYDGQRKCVGII